MSQQISLRLSPKLLNDAKQYAKKHGYRSVQMLVEESVREKLYEELTPKEMELVERTMRMAKERPDLFVGEEELDKAFRRHSEKRK